jgi:hypothetical protein
LVVVTLHLALPTRAGKFHSSRRWWCCLNRPPTRRSDTPPFMVLKLIFPVTSLIEMLRYSQQAKDQSVAAIKIS